MFTQGNTLTYMYISIYMLILFYLPSTDRIYTYNIYIYVLIYRKFSALSAVVYVSSRDWFTKKTVVEDLYGAV